MKQYLIKTSTNWADEIDLDGWLILDENDLAEAKKKVQQLVDADITAELSVGTNEEMDVDADEVLDELNNAIELTPEEAEEIYNKAFPRGGKVNCGLAEYDDPYDAGQKQEIEELKRKIEQYEQRIKELEEKPAENFVRAEIGFGEC